MKLNGFTLIELLIVIAILGVLAVVVLVAINPGEQLARSRDAGRKSAINQVGHILQIYATANGGVVIDESATWLTDLRTAGAMDSIPDEINHSDGSTTLCATNEERGYCYDTDGGSPPNFGIVYTRIEANNDISKCATGEIPWMVYDTHAGRGGLVCSASDPVYDAAGQTYVN